MIWRKATEFFSPDNSDGKTDIDSDDQDSAEVTTPLPYREQYPIKAEKEVNLVEAREIMGDKFFGPEEIGKTYNVEITEVPPIPFSVEVLERAKKKGMFLIMRVEKTAEYEPNDMIRMHCMSIGRDTLEFLHSQDESDLRYKKNTPYLHEKLENGWSLVATSPLPKSKGKTFLEHDVMLADAIEEQFDGLDLPDGIQNAVDKFNDEKDEIAAMRRSRDTVLKGDRRLVHHRFNRYARASLTEMYHYYFVLKANGKEDLLKNYRDNNRITTRTIQFAPDEHTALKVHSTKLFSVWNSGSENERIVSNSVSTNLAFNFHDAYVVLNQGTY